MLIAADYPFLNILWSMIIFFAWVAWLFILIRVIADIFRRHDTSGWGKAAWLVFVIVLPFLGVFIYLIANGDEMGQRDLDQARAAQANMDDYVKSVAGSGGRDDADIMSAGSGCSCERRCGDQLGEFA